MTNESKNWQLQCAGWKQRGAYLYKTKLWSDVSFKFENEENETEIIKAHKLIMAMASPVFARMFFGEVREKVNPIPVVDVRPEIFNILLEYIYTDNLRIKINPIAACDLYNLAKKWCLTYVMKECYHYVLKNMTPDNVCNIYQVACANQQSLLIDASLQVLKTKTDEVLSDKSFYKSRLDIVKAIFTLPELNINTELDLFKALVRHAEYNVWTAGKQAPDCAQKSHRQIEPEVFDGPSPMKQPRLDSDKCREKELAVEEDSMTGEKEAQQDSTPRIVIYTDDDDEEGNDEFLKANPQQIDKELYRPIVSHIRFLTLSPHEFARCKQLGKLLTQADILALSMNISSKDTIVPMPDGFSLSMVPRTQIMEAEIGRNAATFRSTLHNVRTISHYESAPFYVRNLAWTLMVMRHAHRQDLLVFGVTCFYESGVPPWISHARIKLKLCTHKVVPKRLQKLKLDHNHCESDVYGAWATKLNWSDLWNPEYGFVDDNTITYKVTVDTVPKPSSSLHDLARQSTINDQNTSSDEKNLPEKTLSSDLPLKKRLSSDMPSRNLPASRRKSVEQTQKRTNDKVQSGESSQAGNMDMSSVTCQQNSDGHKNDVSDVTSRSSLEQFRGLRKNDKSSVPSIRHILNAVTGIKTSQQVTNNETRSKEESQLNENDTTDNAKKDCSDYGPPSPDNVRHKTSQKPKETLSTLRSPTTPHHFGQSTSKLKLDDSAVPSPPKIQLKTKSDTIPYKKLPSVGEITPANAEVTKPCTISSSKIKYPNEPRTTDARDKNKIQDLPLSKNHNVPSKPSLTDAGPSKIVTKSTFGATGKLSSSLLVAGGSVGVVLKRRLESSPSEHPSKRVANDDHSYSKEANDNTETPELAEQKAMQSVQNVTRCLVCPLEEASSRAINANVQLTQSLQDSQAATATNSLQSFCANEAISGIRLLVPDSKYSGVDTPICVAKTVEDITNIKMTAQEIGILYNLVSPNNTKTTEEFKKEFLNKWLQMIKSGYNEEDLHGTVHKIGEIINKINGLALGSVFELHTTQSSKLNRSISMDPSLARNLVVYKPARATPEFLLVTHRDKKRVRPLPLLAFASEYQDMQRFLINVTLPSGESSCNQNDHPTAQSSVTSPNPIGSLSKTIPLTASYVTSTIAVGASNMVHKSSGIIINSVPQGITQNSTAAPNTIGFSTAAQNAASCSTAAQNTSGSLSKTIQIISETKSSITTTEYDMAVEIAKMAAKIQVPKTFQSAAKFFENVPITNVSDFTVITTSNKAFSTRINTMSAIASNTVKITKMKTETNNTTSAPQIDTTSVTSSVKVLSSASETAKTFSNASDIVTSSSSTLTRVLSVAEINSSLEPNISASTLTEIPTSLTAISIAGSSTTDTIDGAPLLKTATGGIAIKDCYVKISASDHLLLRIASKAVARAENEDSKNNFDANRKNVNFEEEISDEMDIHDSSMIDGTNENASKENGPYNVNNNEISTEDTKYSPKHTSNELDTDKDLKWLKSEPNILADDDEQLVKSVENDVRVKSNDYESEDEDFETDLIKIVKYEPNQNSHLFGETSQRDVEVAQLETQDKLSLEWLDMIAWLKEFCQKASTNTPQPLKKIASTGFRSLLGTPIDNFNDDATVILETPGIKDQQLDIQENLNIGDSLMETESREPEKQNHENLLVTPLNEVKQKDHSLEWLEMLAKFNEFETKVSENTTPLSLKEQAMSNINGWMNNSYNADDSNTGKYLTRKENEIQAQTHQDPKFLNTQQRESRSLEWVEMMAWCIKQEANAEKTTSKDHGRLENDEQAHTLKAKQEIRTLEWLNEIDRTVFTYNTPPSLKEQALSTVKDLFSKKHNDNKTDMFFNPTSERNENTVKNESIGESDLDASEVNYDRFATGLDISMDIDPVTMVKQCQINYEQ